jgi:RHS repeat-associated protein
MSNHIGNVLTVINDIKIPVSSNSVDIDGYSATIVGTADYSPKVSFAAAFGGGVQLDGRTVSAESYRWGFQGQETDNEIKGEGNSVNYTYRMHDPRLGRFLSRDPLSSKYPFYSPYQFSGNIPIRFKELEGCEPSDDGAFYGETKVAVVQGQDNVQANLKYFVWVETLAADNPDVTGKWMICTRPVDIVAENNVGQKLSLSYLYLVNNPAEDPSQPSPPLVLSPEAMTLWANENNRHDIVDNPRIAPTNSGRIESGRYGYTRFREDGSKKFHDGVDLAADSGQPVYAGLSGRVVAIQWRYDNDSKGDNGYGNCVVIETQGYSGTIRIKYAHLNGSAVKVGDNVEAGDVIGTSGKTGNAHNVNNPHVHVGARLNGNSTDPEPLLNTTFDDTTGESLPR